jgi:eukaryotic-like serine/threonine-protein kinase
VTSQASRATAAQPGRERILAATLVLAIIAAGVGWMRGASEPAPSRQQVVLWKHQLPDGLAPGAQIISTQVAIAPDGSSIVFVDSTPQGFVLMQKRRGAVRAEPIAGTEGGVSPFFSPDGAWIAFLTMDRRIRKVPVAGGGVITLNSDVNADWKVGAWADDGHIYYTSAGSLISRLDANDPTRPSIAMNAIAGASAIGISPLPGSRGVLVAACPGNCAVSSSLYVLDLKNDSLRLLVPGATGGWYSPTGHLLYTGREGGLFAMKFNLSRLTTSSGAVPVIPNVAATSFTLSASGDAIYSLNTVRQGASELVWADKTGRVTPVDSTWREHFEYPALSPDGRTLTVSVTGETTDLWIRRPNGARQKVIAPGSANWRPHWTPDGDTIYFVSVGSGGDPNDVSIRKIRADLGAESELAHRGPFGIWEAETSPDGKWMIFRADEERSITNIRYRALAGDTTPRPLVVDGNNSTSISLSPDGRWLAYSGDDLTGGRFDVFIAPFPAGTPRRLASRGRGSEPRWSRDGRELYFKSATHMMAVSVDGRSGLDVGDPRALFSIAEYRSARNRQQYDVAPDGRFLLIRDPTRGEAAPVVYMQGFLTELRAALRR